MHAVNSNMSEPFECRSKLSMWPLASGQLALDAISNDIST